MYYTNENNYPKAVLFSILVMAILFLISYFIVFSIAEKEEIGIGGIVVNYGTVEVGMGNDYMSIDEPSVAPEVTQSLPVKMNIQTSNANTSSRNDDLVTQNTEETVSLPQKQQTSGSATQTNINKNQSSEPAINPNALYKGRKNNGTGQGDGTGNTPGNQGSNNGDPLSSNYGEGGSGVGGVRLSLENRRFTVSPHINDNGQSSGKIAVQIQVDKNGQVINARAGVKGTTLSDAGLWRKCEQAALSARLNALESAPDVQIGTIIFNFRVK